MVVRLFFSGVSIAVPRRLCCTRGGVFMFLCVAEERWWTFCRVPRSTACTPRVSYMPEMV